MGFVNDKSLILVRDPVALTERAILPGDINAKFEHSREMDKALARENKPHELIVIKDGVHSLSQPVIRLTLYQALERFLAQHLNP